MKPRALISVFDKTNIAILAQALIDLGWEIISTGGTATTLRKARIPVTDVQDVTNFPEMLDGRVKTLNPKIHGGLLHIRGNADHERTIREHGIEPIDMVVVNLYPFEETIKKDGVTEPEAVEQIDIGGPSMLRSGAKNFESVTVISDPSDYRSVIQVMKVNGGNTTREFRKWLAAKVFATTGRYDTAIADYLFGRLDFEA